MNVIGIICAMEKEYELLHSSLSDVLIATDNSFYARTEQDGGYALLVSKSGIGKVNAALCARQMIGADVDFIISTGVAGAADASLKVGDIVVGNSYCYSDVWCGQPNMPGQIQGLPAVFPSSFGIWMEKLPEDTVFGTIASGDWFVQSREKMESIKNFLPDVYNVVAIDMESAAIAHVCYKENMPFMSIRVISDNPLLPHQQQQYDGFWEDIAQKSFSNLCKILK